MERIPDMTTPGGYLVQSSSNIELQHEITVMENETKGCACNDFRYNNIARNHVYLLNCLHAGIAPFKGRLNIVSFEQVDSVDHFDTINIAAENRVVATEHPSMSQYNSQDGRSSCSLMFYIEKICTV
ncbi:unnamed protein product [Rhizopus microsporus]